MQERWRKISAFPNYRISNLGRVESYKSGREIKPTVNQQGFYKVNLMRDGETHTRQVNKLVAEAFLPEPRRSDFISLIHLDGDKTNCSADNLAWRPRHFAIRYHQQFDTPAWFESEIPIIDIKNQRVYNKIQDAVLEHGLVFSEILASAHNFTFVWPTYQQFRLLV